MASNGKLSPPVSIPYILHRKCRESPRFCLQKFQQCDSSWDLNFNMLVQEKSAPLTELCDIFNLTNIVKEPTCFPKNSNPSLVDVILTNNPKTFNGTRMCNTGLSDVHRLVACVMKNTVKQTRNGKTTYRSFKNLDETALLRDIENAPLHVADIFDDIDR